jgi:DNA-directed RNA polymerase
VYATLNYLGRTPLRVRRNVLEVALEARDHGLDLPDIPVSRPRFPEPQKPSDIATNDKARAKYRQDRARIIEANMRLASEELANEDALAEAELFVDESEIYFPHGCDFRGRMYPLPTGLQAQGSDLRRSLLEFATGKPISSDDASSGWLAIQVAKTFGQDKQPFEDRIQWVFDNEELIRTIADDPLGNRQLWMSEADKPWQCLAACREWRDFLDHGDGFVSHLPVFVDGTCNGIQHFAAIARDPELARMVNLSPSDTPQDVYRVVADMAMAKVHREIEVNGRGALYAMMWLDALEGFPMRSLAKQPVMTRPYGGSFKTILDDVRDKLREKADPHYAIISEEDEPKAAGFMGTCLKNSLSEILSHPDTVLKWLQACVEAVHKKGVTGIEPGFGWKAPSGWPWGLMYGVEKMVHIAAERAGQRVLTGYRETDKKRVDLKRQKQAASPNFVHALDASAMVFAINILEDSTPVGGIIAIHDAVGALAADIPYVDTAIRAGFVELYTEHDPVTSFYKATLDQVRPEARGSVPPPPELGGFDIREVLRSPYFFS